jgi:mRNA-degrading endonuclease RelE of RelBE toxin-antitoxin system
MRRVVLTVEAEAQFDKLPATIQARVLTVIERLRSWPNVSGAKAMRGDLKGYHRIRTGDWRVLFRVEADVIVVRIAHRSTVYGD